jgi:hypothetical protein
MIMLRGNSIFYRKQRKNSNFFWFFLFGSVVIVGVLILVFGPRIPRLFSRIGTTPEALTASPYAVWSRGQFIQEITQLKEQVRAQDVLLDRLIQAQESYRYQETFLAKDRLDTGLILRIFEQPALGAHVPWYGMILQTDGREIRIGDGIRFGGSLVGIITEHEGDWVSGTSLFGMQEALEGFLLLDEGPLGIVLESAGAGMFEARIPRGVTVPTGTRIESRAFPGLLIGEVTSVRFDPRDPAQEALIAPRTILRDVDVASHVARPLTRIPFTQEINEPLYDAEPENQ